ncbi:hypothetical protein OG607_07885 [Streptomyces sp. NBC_01537]|uniref:hypothetical protein n=1 Tax=Streptomyces sp. NBC_01537 TaxID=2903896 RepID=UPI003870AAC2
MESTRQRLLDLITDPDDAYNRSAADLEPLQLRAAQALFEERREQIPLVGRRAEDAGIDEIRSLDDLVPLLFAHTVYKSYPQSFFDQGRWDRMLRWLDTLSVDSVVDVDVEGVADVDDWLDRLWAAGHQVLATSGTTGKCSFLNHTRGDGERKRRHIRHTHGWPLIASSPQWPFFWLGPMAGYSSAVEAAVINAENWARPGLVHALTDKPLRISDVSRMAAFRKRMADGTATPEEITAIRDESAARAVEGRDALRRLADELLDRRHEPVWVSGMWAQHMAIIDRARERGIPDGDFHPGSVVGAGGGTKSVALPPDYRDQVARFYGEVLRPASYGMTELGQQLPRCEAGRYHRAPGLITLILDPPAEKLLGPEQASGDGLVQGRFAFLDLSHEGRWGGVITGDRVTVDHSERCACGRYGPTFLDDISRIAQPGEDDHIGCAGTIDSYIRGVVEDV